MCSVKISFERVHAAACRSFVWPLSTGMALQTSFQRCEPVEKVSGACLQELTFETQYLAAISLVTAILFGNTFAFSFDRQRQIIQEMAEEIFALELLLQELFIDIPEPHLRWRVIKNIKCALPHTHLMRCSAWHPQME